MIDFIKKLTVALSDEELAMLGTAVWAERSRRLEIYAATLGKDVELLEVEKALIREHNCTDAARIYRARHNCSLSDAVKRCRAYQDTI